MAIFLRGIFPTLLLSISGSPSTKIQKITAANRGTRNTDAGIYAAYISFAFTHAHPGLDIDIVIDAVHIVKHGE